MKYNKYRSRSAYKLLEIQKKFNIFKKNSRLIEFGSYPGGCTQVLKNIINSKHGKILSIDRKMMDPIKNVYFFFGDIFKSDFLRKIKKKCINLKINNIFSDLSPNLSGNKIIDEESFYKTIKTIMIFFLDINAKIIILKIFIKNKIILFIKEFIRKINFIFVKFYKPAFSKKHSQETYLILIK